MPITIQMKVAERTFSQLLINFNKVSALKNLDCGHLNEILSSTKC